MWRNNAVMYVTVPYIKVLFPALYFLNHSIGGWFWNCPRTLTLLINVLGVFIVHFSNAVYTNTRKLLSGRPQNAGTGILLRHTTNCFILFYHFSLKSYIPSLISITEPVYSKISYHILYLLESFEMWCWRRMEIN
jgi:hypothetical protein